MAEIGFFVKTDWAEVEKLVHEIDALNKTIASVNTDIPRSQIDKLTDKLNELKSKYSEIISYAARANADIADIFGKNGGLGSAGAQGISQSVTSEMQKMQEVVSGVFDTLLRKVDEFKNSVNETLSFTADIKVSDSSMSVIDSMTEKMSALSAEAERQKVIFSDQAVQNNTIIQQQQQETASLNSQGSQMQALIGNTDERVSIEGDMASAVDNTTDNIKKQTDAFKEQGETIKENKKILNEPIDDSYGDAAKEELRGNEELIKRYEEELAKLDEQIANAPNGSEEQERAIARYNDVKAQLEAIKNGEEAVIEGIKQESQERENVSQLIKEQYAYLDEIIEKQKNGTLSEQEYQDTVKRVNEEIQARKDSVLDYKEQLEAISSIETKYGPGGVVTNQEEIDEAIRKSEEYERKIEEEEEKVKHLKGVLSEISGIRVDSTTDSINNAGDGIKRFWDIYTRMDDSGKKFHVIASSAEEADEKIQQTKDLLETYPVIMERITKAAEDMRLNAYMTDEGEDLVKEAEALSRSLDGKDVANSFGANGESIGLDAVNRLSDIEEKLNSIQEKEKEIEAENQRIAEAEEQAKEEAEEHANSTMRLRTQIMNAREEMSRMIAEGKKGTPEFLELAESAGEMRYNMQEASAVLNYYSDNQRHLNALKTGLQGVAGAASLVTGVIGLFNKDSERMAEIQTKIQSVLGIVVGLETTYNLVKKESFIRLAAEEVVTWAVAKARGAQAAATTAAATAQNGLNVAMAKNPIGAILTLVVTLGTAIWAVVSALKSGKNEVDALNEELKNNSVALADDRVKLQTLQNEWNALTSDKEKQQWVKDNRKEFEFLGIEIENVSDAEKAFVSNTGIIIQSMELRAKAAAYTAMATKKYQEALANQEEGEKRRNEGPSTWDTIKGIVNVGWDFNFDKSINNEVRKASNELVSNSKKMERDAEDYIEKGAELTRQADELVKGAGFKVKSATDKDKNNPKGGNSRNTTAERAERERALLDKQERDRQRQAKDLEFSTREAQIKAMEDGTDKVLAQIKLDHDREVEAINRSYEDMRLKRIEAAKQLWESDQKNKGKNFYESEEFKKANVNSEAETQNFNERIKTAQVAEKKQIEDIQKQQVQSMIDYLKEYGTFQQKKLAITKEYEKKIAKARRLGNIGEVKKLEAERNKELSTYKAQELAQGIDFSQITKGFNKMLDGIAKETYNRIQEYRKTDEYKNSLPESKQAIANLEQQLIEKGAAGTISPFGSWKEINEHSKELDEAIKRTQEAVKNHNMAVERLTAAQNDLKRARQQGRSTFEITLLQGAVTQAEKDVQNTGEKVQQEQSNQQDKQQKLQTDFKKVDQGLSDFDQMLNQITSGSLSGFADGVSNLIALITKDDDKMGKGLVGLIGEKAGGIIGAIISIIEALGDKPVEFIESLFKKIETVVEEVLKNLPQIIGSIVEGIGGILGGLGQGILGMFGIDFGSSNREEIERENKKLANATIVNTEALNRLTEEMKKQNPTEAYKTYEEAVRLMEINEKNAMRTMENNASIHDGGHSLSYDFKNNSGLVMYIDKDGYGYMESKGVNLSRMMYNYLGKNPFDGSYDIGSMVNDFTAEDWNKLLKEKPEWMTELGNIIASVEDDGNYNGIFQDILNFASEFNPEKYEDLFISFQETITHLSFDSMYDSFVSSLMDMDKKAEDFAKDFEGYIRNAVYQAMAVDQLKEPLENWYKALANAMKSRESNGRYMSKEEIKELMETGGSYVDESGNTQTFMSYQEIMQIGTSIRDAVGELGLNENSNDKQSATFNSAQNITYEQADALVGILTAQLIVQEQGKADLSLLTASVSQLTPLYMEQRDIAADSRDILAGMAIHVEEIRDGVVDTIVPRIKNIDNNLDKVYKLVEAQ